MFIVKSIIRREFLNFIKNPVFYVGAILVFLGVYQNVSPYLTIHYFKQESEMLAVDESNYGQLSDADIMQGYIPTTKEEQYDLGLKTIKKNMIAGLGMNAKEADGILSVIKEQKMSIPEIDNFLEKNYSFCNGANCFYEVDKRKATVDEANHYMKASLRKETFTAYFARKYVDYLGVYIIFYAIILLAFLYWRDTKKDIYELLHTKPMKPWEYLTGKILGGLSAIYLVAFLISFIYNILAIKQGIKAGLPISFWDLWKTLILYIIPNLFMVLSVYTGVSIIFKNPLPAVPALVLYMIYSNMGTYSADGSFGYMIRKYAILVRFPDYFFETVTPAQAIYNQWFLVMVAMIITYSSILVWKRRRVY